MRALTLTTLAALAALLTASAPASAQEAPDAWVKLAPEPGGFVALMPAQPATQDVRVEAGALKVAGRSYVAADEGGATYTVIALDFPKEVGERLIAANKGYVSARFGAEAVYLDEIAEVAWEALVRPEYDRLKREKVEDVHVGMEYRREFSLAGRPAREYLVKLQKAGGPVYVCADGPRVYVVAALGPASQSAQSTRFVESFSPDASAPPPPKTPADTGSGVGSGVGPGTGLGPGRGENAGAGEIDYTRVFRPTDVTQKAIIISKPDPGFSESARKFNVTGVVRLRAVLDRAGKVTNMSVVKGLPHGLTTRAINAARDIQFKPAQKDGRAVSQYVTFEYNFNIY